MPLEPRTRLGSYEIVSLLGHGGMGEVYRARDLKLNRDVAIKVLPDHLTQDIERLGRLRREAQVLAALSHPNIGHITAGDRFDAGRPQELWRGPYSHGMSSRAQGGTA